MSSPDRRLRRMVEQLSSLDRQDRDAILEDLDPRRRMRLEGLLSQREPNVVALSLAQSSQAASSITPDALPPGISPWLAERLGLGIEALPDAPAHGVMTTHAVATLRDCLRELAPPPPTTSVRPMLARFRKLLRHRSGSGSGRA